MSKKLPRCVNCSNLRQTTSVFCKECERSYYRSLEKTSAELVDEEGHEVHRSLGPGCYHTQNIQNNA